MSEVNACRFVLLQDDLTYDCNLNRCKHVMSPIATMLLSMLKLLKQ